MTGNTTLRYMYRDTHNRKWYADVTFTGTATPDQLSRLKSHLLPARHFLPAQVKLPDLIAQIPRRFQDDTAAPDAWRHEFLALEPTTGDPDDPRTITEFIDEFAATPWTASISDQDLAALTYNHHKDLNQLLGFVHTCVPRASYFTVTASDQNAYGFTLHEVTLDTGELLSQIDPGLLTQLQHDGWTYLAPIDWSVILGENEHAVAVLVI